MASTYLDYIVVTIVVVMGLVIFYRALREPLDLIFGWIGSIFGWAREKIVGGGGNTYEMIQYG